MGLQERICNGRRSHDLRRLREPVAHLYGAYCKGSQLCSGRIEKRKHLNHRNYLNMNRRDAVSRVALLLGATVIGADFFLSGCKLSNKEDKKGNPLDFSKDDIAYLDEIAETIIPTTDSPGAKAAMTGAFMTVMVRDSYDEKQQKSFLEGMKKIEASSEKKFNKRLYAAHR